jgi:large subunit ribosomal protein L1
MPSPKSGTVSDDVVAVAKELLAGKFEFKNDKLGSIHSIVGKLSFGSKKLIDNISFFLQTMKDARPKGLKSGEIFIKSAYLANTMGPGIRLELK